jgi:hypothetical protein
MLTATCRRRSRSTSSGDIPETGAGKSDLPASRSPTRTGTPVCIVIFHPPATSAYMAVCSCQSNSTSAGRSTVKHRLDGRSKAHYVRLMIELIAGSSDTGAMARIRNAVMRWILTEPQTIEHSRGTMPGYPAVASLSTRLPMLLPAAQTILKT